VKLHWFYFNWILVKYCTVPVIQQKNVCKNKYSTEKLFKKEKNIVLCKNFLTQVFCLGYRVDKRDKKKQNGASFS
jgi:hypothetical protein